MGLYNKLADDIDEVDIIVAGGEWTSPAAYLALCTWSRVIDRN